MQGIGDFLGRVDQVKRYREGLRVLSIIPTFYDGRVRKSAEILEQLGRYFPDALWPCALQLQALGSPRVRPAHLRVLEKEQRGRRLRPSGQRLAKGDKRKHGQEKKEPEDLMGTILSESFEADEKQTLSASRVSPAPSFPGTKRQSGWASHSTSPNSSAPNWRAPVGASAGGCSPSRVRDRRGGASDRRGGCERVGRRVNCP